MFKTLLVSTLLTLGVSGCMASVDAHQIYAAQVACASHNGVDYFSDMNGIYCNDSTRVGWDNAKKMAQEMSKETEL